MTSTQPIQRQKLTILVMGSRNYTDWPHFCQALNHETYRVEPHEITIRHGACPTGADQLTHEWCEVGVEALAAGGHLLREDAMPAQWDVCGPRCPSRPHRVQKRPGDVHHPGELPDYCPTAGPRRNAAMVALGADVALAFPLGPSRGTRDAMNRARRAGIEVKLP